MKRFLIIFTIWAISLSLIQARAGWEKVYDKDGIHVFSKNIPNSDIVSFKALGVLKAPSAKIMALLRHVEGASQWTPNLVEKKVVEGYPLNDLEAVTYSLSKLMLFVSDRDFVVKNKLVLDKQSGFLILTTDSFDDKKVSIKKGVIRAEIHTVMKFKPHADGMYVEMVVHADPRGSLPSWLVNFVQKKWPYKFLKRIEKFANESSLPLNLGMKKLLSQVNVLEK